MAFLMLLLMCIIYINQVPVPYIECVHSSKSEIFKLSMNILLYATCVPWF